MEDIITDAIDAIEEFFEDMFRGLLEDRLQTMFDFVDDATGIVSSEVGKTPNTWNSTIFNTLQSISDTVILPIGTMIITALLCYEIITMVINGNHMGRDGGETSFFFIIIFKAMVAVYLLGHSFEITMAVFDVGSHIVNTVTGSYLTKDADSLAAFGLDAFRNEINNMDLIELMGATLEAILINTGLSIMSIIIVIILYGRMMEIYMYISVAPIPFATFLNKEWGIIGTNYIRTISALSFQTFFIIICVVMFNALVTNISTSGLIRGMWDVLLYTVLLCIMLFKSGSISKSIFNAH